VEVIPVIPTAITTPVGTRERVCSGCGVRLARGAGQEIRIEQGRGDLIADEEWVCGPACALEWIEANYLRPATDEDGMLAEAVQIGLRLTPV
jgi:hypothetical protein